MKIFLNKHQAYFISLFFILSLVLTAVVLHTKEIILPEVASMAVGMWVYQDSGWIKEPACIFLAPSGTAMIGFFINGLSLDYSMKILITSILMALFLFLVNTNLAPALATGFLPIVVHATDISFLIAIFITTLILMIGVLEFTDWQLAAFQHEQTSRKMRPYLLLILGIAGWVGITLLINQTEMGIIPPVIVVYFEVLNKPMYSFRMLIKQSIILALSSLISVGSVIILHEWLLSVAIALPIIWGLLRIMHAQLPAAYAFPLLSLILPEPMMHHLPYTTLLLSANYKFNPNKPGIFQWQSVDDVFLMVVD